MKYFLLYILLTVSISMKAQTLSLWATYYYVPVYIHSNTGIPLLNEEEKPIGAKLDSCDWCSACIEGTVLVQKAGAEYLYTYAGRSTQLQYDCRKCVKYAGYKNYEKTGQVLWTLSEGYGKGVKNYKLVPYRTIAVDPKIIPFGSVIYISAADGMTVTLDNGESWIHDGYFFAGDAGSAIEGNHIDIFTGKNQRQPFSFVYSNPNVQVEAGIETDPMVVERLTKMHE